MFCLKEWYRKIKILRNGNEFVWASSNTERALGLLEDQPWKVCIVMESAVTSSAFYTVVMEEMFLSFAAEIGMRYLLPRS